VIAEEDDAVFARRLGLRDGQVWLVVLGEPHVDEVGEVAWRGVNRVESLPVGAPFWPDFIPLPGVLLVARVVRLLDSKWLHLEHEHCNLNFLFLSPEERDEFLEGQIDTAEYCMQGPSIQFHMIRHNYFRKWHVPA
jgi:hypothetical protein